jgi:transposase
LTRFTGHQGQITVSGNAGQALSSSVELYRVTEGATISKIAGDLGITDATLSMWIKAAGVTVRGRHGPPEGPVPPDEVARLRARVLELEASERTRATERDILRAAAKYFAGETNW